MKTIFVFPAPMVLETQKSFFESPPLADFQKNDFYNANCWAQKKWGCKQP
ncbi:MAG: hypothetical protein ACK5RE_20265 [Pseudanabaena sp.]|jgi:hypothetical protein